MRDVFTAFEAALHTAGFRPSTARRYALVAEQFSRASSLDDIPETMVNTAAARAWLAWPESGRAHANASLVAQGVIARADAHAAGDRTSLQKRRNAQARRKHEARSIPDASWVKLTALLHRMGDVEAAALRVLMSTGLRVGDLLATPTAALLEGQRTGIIVLEAKGGERRLLPWSGAPDDWAVLTGFAEIRPKMPTVAALIDGRRNARADSNGNAYARLRSTLQRVATAAGITDRMHLHRLRRTVAVQALRVTDDTAAVQQLLGHRTIATTARYLDEARPDALAGVQQKIQQRFQKGESKS